MKFSFKKYQPWSLRLWHWLNAFVISVLLGTVFLRKTFLAARVNAGLIENKVKAAGGVVPSGVAKEIAQTLRDQMWDWHFTFGFILAGLLTARILIGIILKKECPATSAINAARNLPKVDCTQVKPAFHFTLVKIGYALFYLVTTYMVFSGLMMYYQEALHISEGHADILKEIHEAAMWFFVVFVVGHIGGVVVAELRGERGLVSDMINGGDKASK